MPIDSSISTRLAAVPEITATTQRNAAGAELDVVCQLAMDAARALVTEAGALDGRVTALEGAPAGTVLSVNGVEPDGAGDVELVAADIGAADATETAAALLEIDGRLDALEASPGGGVSIYYRADDLDAAEDDDAIRLAADPYSGAVTVHKNGALLRAVQAALTGRNIALSTPAVDGDWYSVRYWTETAAPGASVMLRTLTLTGTLPLATVGVAYSAGLTRDGGAAPFAWSVSAGSLPAGLSINGSTGVISGTPSAAAVESITIRVESDDGQVATSAQTLTVQGAANEWDAAKASAPVVISEAGQKLTANTAASGTYATAQSKLALSGLCYFSGQVSVAAGAGERSAIGVSDATFAATSAANWAGNSTTSVAAWANSGTVYRNGSAVGSVTGASVINVEFAVRVASRRVWVRRNGGAWVGGGDPAADTSPTYTLAGTGALFVVGTVERNAAGSDRYSVLHGSLADTTGTPPSGFTAANWA